jgi:hypothetical protein
MAGGAFQPVLNRQVLHQTAGWGAVKGRVVFPTSSGTGGIRRWVSAHQPVEKPLLLVGKR